MESQVNFTKPGAAAHAKRRQLSLAHQGSVTNAGPCPYCKGDRYLIEEDDSGKFPTPCHCQKENFEMEEEWRDIVAVATAQYMARMGAN